MTDLPKHFENLVLAQSLDDHLLHDLPQFGVRPYARPLLTFSVLWFVRGCSGVCLGVSILPGRRIVACGKLTSERLGIYVRESQAFGRSLLR